MRATNGHDKNSMVFPEDLILEGFSDVHERAQKARMDKRSSIVEARRKKGDTSAQGGTQAGTGQKDDSSLDDSNSL